MLGMRLAVFVAMVLSMPLLHLSAAIGEQQVRDRTQLASGRPAAAAAKGTLSFGNPHYASAAIQALHAVTLSKQQNVLIQQVYKAEIVSLLTIAKQARMPGESARRRHIALLALSNQKLHAAILKVLTPVQRVQFETSLARQKAP